MSAPFFITGFPRSRTAWFAAFLSGGGRLCYHDGLRGCAGVDDFKRKMERAGVVGDSDSGLPMFFDDVERLWPEAKWVVIERPVGEALAACVKAFPSLLKVDSSLLTFAYLDKLLDPVRKRALRVRFDRLDDARDVEKVCAHVGVPFDRAKWRLFDRLKIEPHPAKTRLHEARTEMWALAKALHKTEDLCQ